jgi:endonuclease G, mitochondrial
MEVDPGSPATPVVVEDLSGRAGLDELLLGIEVPLPQLSDPEIATVRLDYTHFSVLMRPDRRLAAVSGVGIDGARLVDLDRAGIDWRFDPRIPAGHQVGDPVYAGNDLDRGHLTRRADAVWGDTAAEAQLGNSDTFHFTNAAPQAAKFNQGQLLWQGLENYLLDNAATYDRRLVVFTGPVFDGGDPTYRGVQLPLRFYKVAAFIDGDEPRTDLAATGYVLDQTPLVDDLSAALDQARAAGQPPPLGPFRTFQVPIGDIAGLTGLALGQLATVDRFATVTADASGAGWVQLETLDDIRW